MALPAVELALILVQNLKSKIFDDQRSPLTLVLFVVTLPLVYQVEQYNTSPSSKPPV